MNSNFFNGGNTQPKNSTGSKSAEDKVDQDAGRKRKKIVISDSEESESEEAMTKKIRAEDISKTRTESGDVVMTEASDSQDVDKEIEEAAAEEKEEKQEQKETKAVIQIL
jgi:DNA ligase-1